MPNAKELADEVLGKLERDEYKHWTDDLGQIKAVLGMVIDSAQRIKLQVSEDEWAFLKWQFYGLCKNIIGIQETEDYHNFIHYLNRELGL